MSIFDKELIPKEQQPSQPQKKKSWLRRLINAVKYFFIAIGVFTVIQYIGMIVLILSIISALKDKRPEWQNSWDRISEEVEELSDKDKVVVIDLSRSVYDHIDPLTAWINQLTQETSLTLLDVAEAIHAISQDDKVKAVIIREPRQMSLSRAIEIKDLINTLKSAKKPVYAWSGDLDTVGYLLASNADKLVVPVSGQLELTGPSFTLTYFYSLLNKLGIQFEVIRAGKYKSAFESFIRDEPSPETLEMYESMEDSWRQYYAQEISSSRDKPIEQVRRWLTESLYTAQAALDEGMIDEINSWNALVESLAITSSEEDDKPHLVGLATYLKLANKNERPKNTLMPQGGIGIIFANGEIVMQSSSNDNHQVISPKMMHEAIDWAKKSNHIKAVILRVNSPGGSALASEMIWNELKGLSKVKPLIVSMHNVAASGGYYISVAAQTIFAEPGTLTGSIGVIGAIPNLSAFKEKYGVSFYSITQSRVKSLINPGEPLSPYEHAALGNLIEQTYQIFLNRVAEGRNMKVEDVDALAQGRVYTGLQALELGLVDELGGFYDAIKYAQKTAGFKPTDKNPVYLYQDDTFCFSFWDKCQSSEKRFININSLIQTAQYLIQSQKPIEEQARDKILKKIQLLNFNKPLSIWLDWYAVAAMP